MKNRTNFIPKKSPIQPTRYQNLAGNWEAHFHDEFGNLFIISMNTKPWDREKADSVSVVVQFPTFRKTFFRGKTIKSAVTFLNGFMTGLEDERKLYAHARDEYNHYQVIIQSAFGGGYNVPALRNELFQKSCDAETDYLIDMYRILRKQLDRSLEQQFTA